MMNYRPKRRPMPSAILCFFMMAVLFGAFIPSKTSAQVIIRDTEIESILKKWSEPVIRAAGLSPDGVNLIIVQDSNINAFVAGGPNIFLFTGLIEASESPGELLGVIAHEVGHIRGGHLVRTRDAMQNATYESILGAILGIGVAALTGEGGAAAAITAGTQQSAARRFMSFSRVQESSADQAALSYFEKSGMNPSGLVSFMQKLENEELLPPSQQSEYFRTHPLTRNRVQALEAGKERSAYKDEVFPQEWYDDHARIKAKITAFIQPERVAWDYDTRDTSIAAQYARAVALYRENRTDQALGAINDLIEREPDNPFFQELKGQMLVDFGRVDEAIVPYKTAISLSEKRGLSAPLIRAAYAHSLIESASGRSDPKYDEAIKILNSALRDEPRSTRIFRLLATAHGRKGEDDMAKLYLAEENLRIGRIKDAKIQSEAALQSLPEGSRPWLRAKDILNAIEQAEENN